MADVFIDSFYHIMLTQRDEIVKKISNVVKLVTLSAVAKKLDIDNMIRK